VGRCRRLQADLPVFGGGGIPWVVSGGWLGPFVGGRCGDSSSSSRVSVPGALAVIHDVWCVFVMWWLGLGSFCAWLGLLLGGWGCLRWWWWFEILVGVVWWSLSAASLVVVVVGRQGRNASCNVPQVVTLVMVKLTRDDPEVCFRVLWYLVWLY
jgi:hypothetical protein